jgi:DNA-binding transcriptional LysR family regulator
MDVHHLRAFLAVAEELHFGRASQRLHIAQPALSRTVKQLERDVGEQLFERTTRSVRLTSAGEALVDPARQVLDGLRAARFAVQTAGRGETGRVRMGFAGPSSHLLVGALGRRVREAHPGIELSLQSTTYGPAALRAVVEGELDVAIVRWESGPSEIASRIVAEEHFVLVVPEGHRLAGRGLVSMADCREEPFVALPGDPGSWVRDAFIRAAHDAGYAPDIVQTAPDSWTVMALVAAGIGITFSVDAAVENVVQTGIAVVPLEEGRRPTYSRLVWRRGNPNPALRQVLRASEEVLPTPGLPPGTT